MNHMDDRKIGKKIGTKIGNDGIKNIFCPQRQTKIQSLEFSSKNMEII